MSAAGKTEKTSLFRFLEIKKVSANGEVVGFKPLGFCGNVPSQNISEWLVTASGC